MSVFGLAQFTFCFPILFTTQKTKLVASVARVLFPKGCGWCTTPQRPHLTAERASPRIARYDDEMMRCGTTAANTQLRKGGVRARHKDPMTHFSRNPLQGRPRGRRKYKKFQISSKKKNTKFLALPDDVKMDSNPNAPSAMNAY